MKQLIPLALALTAIAAIAALGLALVYQVTEEPIAAAEKQKRIQAINDVLAGITYANDPAPFPGAADFINSQMAAAAQAGDEETLARLCGEEMKAFLENPVGDESAITAPDWYKFGDFWYFLARDESGGLVGIAARVFSNQGYGGYVETFIGLDTESKIIGLRVTDHRETPGLGSKMNEPEFKDQFIGNSLSSFSFEVTKSGEQGKIQAIAGATISSRAVADPVREGLKLLKENRSILPKTRELEQETAQ